MTGRLAGRRILITGAGSGIGLACVERFVQEGARVAALDIDARRLAQLQARSLAGNAEQFLEDPNHSPLIPAKAGIQAALDPGLRRGERSVVDKGAAPLETLVADVADAGSIGEAVAAAVAGLGGLDGVVNAAGIDLVAPLEAMDAAQWSRLMAVNLTGPMLVCQAAYPHLKAAGGGTIVNVSSGAGLSPLLHRTAYCASKAGLQMFGKALAMEAAAFDIRVNTVCPGAVETPLFRETIDGQPDAEARYEAVRQRYAMKRVAEPRELADAILWLTGDESTYVTGTAIAVDGGRTFH